MHLATLVALLPFLTLSVTANPLPKRQSPTVSLRSSIDSTLCLGLTQGLQPGNDVLLSNVPCVGSQWVSWNIAKGDNTQGVRLAGTAFCIDAGSNPGNFQTLKLYTCYPGLSQQRWYYTDDNHIAITGGNLCIDYAGQGCGRNFCSPGTIICGQGNSAAQSWVSIPPGSSNPPVTSTTVISTSVSTVRTTASASSSAPPSSTPVTPPPAGGRQIFWNGDKTKCLTVTGGSASNGQAVVISACLPTSNPAAVYQSWSINKGAGAVRLAGTTYCLDAGTNPGNGIGAKIWTCYSGLAAQNWYYTDDNHIAVTGGTTCLDVANGAGAGVQQWQCYGGNANQIFTV